MTVQPLAIARRRGNDLRLEAAQQENAKVNGFAKIEFPIEAAATTFRHVPTPRPFAVQPQSEFEQA